MMVVKISDDKINSIREIFITTTSGIWFLAANVSLKKYFLLQMKHLFKL